MAIDVRSLETICAGVLQTERAAQREEDGRFCSRAKEAIGAVDGGEVKRRVVDYVSPKGPGYVVSFVFEKGGKRWRRVVNVGPEAYREMTWFEEVQPKGKTNGTRAD